MRLNSKLATSGLVVALFMQVGLLAAQDNTADSNSGRRTRANFDPAQFQQRMMDNIRTRLVFTNDAEWAAVQPLVQRVLDARRETMTGMGFGRMGGRAAGSTEGSSPQGGENRANAVKPSPEADSLQKMLDDKVPTAELKNALEKYRASRKDKEANLASAQENLRKVLTVRQEAQAALLGLVP